MGECCIPTCRAQTRVPGQYLVPVPTVMVLQAGDRCCQTVSMIQEVTAARLGKPLQVLMWGLQLDDHARGTIAPALPGCQVGAVTHTA